MSLPDSAQPAWPRAKSEDSRCRPSLRISTRTTALGGELDPRDLHFRVALAMPDEFAHALLRLVFEDEHFLGFGLAHDRAHDPRTLDERGAHRDVFAAAAGQNDAVEGDFAAGVGADRVATDRVALAHAELLSVGLDDRVHNRQIVTDGLDGRQTTS